MQIWNVAAQTGFHNAQGFASITAKLICCDIHDRVGADAGESPP